MNKIVLGKNGEDRAALYLEQHGFTILDRNWRARSGEIDIIALKEETIVFVEVKTLPSGVISTLEHELNRRKQKRITETAKRFLAINRKYNNRFIRFDVIVVDMPGFPPVYHMENAFFGVL
ncbi:YraN family protein [Treponema parvum]|uniref:UPF0102 protein HRI96_04170 n=1 Tax=Treponema parvum TaxID=138851 RepID=A0A975EYX2_9SPIR|nr:YraN family protein [Treponema parvum]QTQ11464.1 YraN family protein [Treponema parvum]